MLVEGTGQLLVKRLLLLQGRDKYFEEFFQSRDGQVLPAIIVNSHLLHLAVLFDQLALLGLQGSFPRPLATLTISFVIGVGAAATLRICRGACGRI